jgi:hypothetical protein
VKKSNSSVKTKKFQREKNTFFHADQHEKSRIGKEKWFFHPEQMYLK